jgi:threonine/homoserine/homoserine lactone efflux protein
MPKALAISGMAIAGLLVLMFGLDLAISVPFGRASFAMDVMMLVCGGVLGYMSWNTFREVA